MHIRFLLLTDTLRILPCVETNKARNETETVREVFIEATELGVTLRDSEDRLQETLNVHQDVRKGEKKKKRKRVKRDVIQKRSREEEKIHIETQYIYIYMCLSVPR